MWKKLTKNDVEPLNSYCVRMCCGIGENDEDLYDEFYCLFIDGKFINQGESRGVYDFVNMDDIWIPGGDEDEE